MNTKLSKRTASGALALLLAIGCSKQSSEPRSWGSESAQPPAASKSVASDTDKKCEELLRSPSTKEARDWLKENPKSVFSTGGLDGNVLLAPTVARLYQAGAQKVVIHHTPGGWLSAMVVALPTEREARQKLFALDGELSPLREQEAAQDNGQKYLHYGFE